MSLLHDYRPGSDAAVAERAGAPIRAATRAAAWLAARPALLAAALVLPAYLATLAPTVFLLDSAELTTAAYSLGLVHAPGYAVYLILTHLFLYLPVGDVGYRANLFSAVTSAATCAAAAGLVRRLGGGRLAALVAGLSFGLSFYVWSASVVAEVYALQGLLLAGILLAIVAWRERGGPLPAAAAAGLLGLMLVNSPSGGLLCPGLALAALGDRRRLPRAREVAAAVGAFALALLPVLYLPWRASAGPAFSAIGYFDAGGVFHSDDLARPDVLLAYLSGRQFGGLFFGYGPGEIAGEALRFGHRLAGAYLGVGIPLGIWGAARLWRRSWALGAGLLLSAGAHAAFFVTYRVPDKETMFLPVYLVWAVLLGLGAQALLERARPERAPIEGDGDAATPVSPAKRPGARRRPPERVAQSVLLALPAALLLLNFGYVDVSNVREPAAQGRRRLQAADPGALFLGRWSDAGIMQYHQVVDGVRRDVEVVNVFFAQPAALDGTVRRALADGRPVYSVHREPAIQRSYRFVALDDSYRVLPRPAPDGERGTSGAGQATETTEEEP